MVAKGRLHYLLCQTVRDDSELFHEQLQYMNKPIVHDSIAELLYTRPARRKIYRLFRFTAKLGPPTVKSKACTITSRPIWYIPMPLVDLSGLTHIDHCQVVKRRHDERHLGN